MEWLSNLADETGIVPKTLQDIPEIEEHLQLYWSGFWDLCGHRQSGMGLSPIPLSDILEYGKDVCDLSPSELRLFYGVIRSMDQSLVSFFNKKHESENRRKKKK